MTASRTTAPTGGPAPLGLTSDPSASAGTPKLIVHLQTPSSAPTSVEMVFEGSAARLRTVEVGSGIATTFEPDR